MDAEEDVRQEIMSVLVVFLSILSLVAFFTLGPGIVFYILIIADLAAGFYMTRSLAREDIEAQEKEKKDRKYNKGRRS
jgi:hypothetical protein